MSWLPTAGVRRITVLADHGRPVGVATLRSFRIRAISWADLSANSAKMGRNRSARSLAAASLSRFGIGAQSLQKSPNCQPLYDEPRSLPRWAQMRQLVWWAARSHRASPRAAPNNIAIFTRADFFVESQRAYYLAFLLLI